MYFLGDQGPIIMNFTRIAWYDSTRLSTERDLEGNRRRPYPYKARRGAIFVSYLRKRSDICGGNKGTGRSVVQREAVHESDGVRHAIISSAIWNR